MNQTQSAPVASDVVEAGQGEGDGEEAVEDLAEVAADGGGGGAAEHDRCRLG